MYGIGFNKKTTKKLSCHELLLLRYLINFNDLVTIMKPGTLELLSGFMFRVDILFKIKLTSGIP